MFKSSGEIKAQPCIREAKCVLPRGPRPREAKRGLAKRKTGGETRGRKDGTIYALHRSKKAEDMPMVVVFALVNDRTGYGAREPIRRMNKREALFLVLGGWARTLSKQDADLDTV